MEEENVSDRSHNPFFDNDIAIMNFHMAIWTYIGYIREMVGVRYFPTINMMRMQYIRLFANITWY